jgi:hypothetical protein
MSANIAVLGGGPGGYVAAFSARAVRVVLVETNGSAGCPNVADPDQGPGDDCRVVCPLQGAGELGLIPKQGSGFA